MTDKIFPPGSPQPSARVSKVFRAIGVLDGISFLRVEPIPGTPDHCWMREGDPVVRLTWAEINQYVLRDASETDNRPAGQRPSLTLDDAAEAIAEQVGGAEAPESVGMDILGALKTMADMSGATDAVVGFVDMAMIESKFSLAASDPGAFVKRRRWPADGGGHDYEPVSAWVAHACAHVAATLFPQMAVKQVFGVSRPAPEPPPVTTLTAEQLEDAAVAMHRQDCHDDCNVHTMTAFREGLLRSLGAAGVLVRGVPPTKVAEIRMRQHRELVSVVTGIPVERLP